MGEYHGSNGFSDVEFWHPDIYPSDISSIIQQKHAVEIIRDLVLEVSLFEYQKIDHHFSSNIDFLKASPQSFTHWHWSSD